MALRPLPQTLLMVSAETLAGRPPRNAACRAGAWPTPARTTLPKMASVGAAPGTAASTALITWAARSGAARAARPPWNLPMGLRRDFRITAWDMGAPMNGCQLSAVRGRLSVENRQLTRGLRPARGRDGRFIERAEVQPFQIKGRWRRQINI